MRHLNDDPTSRVVLHAAQAEWVPSPLPGVTRRMLARTGNEVARATSIVRYAPMSAFSAHTHGGGEEFLVLAGVFSDEHGDYPAGTYMRNPPGTSHAPSSQPGCLLFVKLWRFAPDDQQPVCIDTHDPTAWQSAMDHQPARCPLHQYRQLVTQLERWRPNEVYAHEPAPGEELLILEGELHDVRGQYPAGTWLRGPAIAPQRRQAGPRGALIYRETGAATLEQISLPELRH